jgi:hypothetical protein
MHEPCDSFQIEPGSLVTLLGGATSIVAAAICDTAQKLLGATFISAREQPMGSIVMTLLVRRQPEDTGIVSYAVCARVSTITQVPETRTPTTARCGQGLKILTEI